MLVAKSDSSAVTDGVLCPWNRITVSRQGLRAAAWVASDRSPGALEIDRLTKIPSLDFSVCWCLAGDLVGARDPANVRTRTGDPPTLPRSTNTMWSPWQGCNPGHSFLTTPELYPWTTLLSRSAHMVADALTIHEYKSTEIWPSTLPNTTGAFLLHASVPYSILQRFLWKPPAKTFQWHNPPHSPPLNLQ